MSEVPNNQMIKSTKKLKKRICKCKKELENLKTLPYYQLFNRDAEKQKDIAAAVAKLEKLKEKYSVASRSLQLSA